MSFSTTDFIQLYVEIRQLFQKLKWTRRKYSGLVSGFFWGGEGGE